MNPVFQLSGKRGLIVGLANDLSIAYGCARMAVQQGASVVTSCANEKALKYVQPLTDELGVTLHTCNVEEEGELEALVEKAVAELGGLDFVVHSIAWAPLADLHGKTINSSSDGFARAMDVSCHSFARLAKLAAPHMNQGGTMVTMSYLGASEAVPNYGIMGPVKAALESLVRSLAQELGPRGIRVNTVVPEWIMTERQKALWARPEAIARHRARQCLPDLIDPVHVARMVLFLASDDALMCTASNYMVEAGSI